MNIKKNNSNCTSVLGAGSLAKSAIGIEKTFCPPPRRRTAKAGFPVLLGCFMLWTVADADQTANQTIHGPEAFSIELPRKTNARMISVADFGASPDETPEQNVDAFNRAILQAKKENAAGVTVPTGTYYLRDSRYLSQIELYDLTDFTFDGQNSVLIFKDHDKKQRGRYFDIKNCTRFLMKNIILDWDWEEKPLGAVGKIIAVDTGKGTLDYEIIDDINLPETITVMGGREWDPSITNRSPAGFILPGAIITGPSGETQVLNKRKIRIKPVNPNALRTAKLGQHSFLTFYVNYLADAIKFRECSHITFDSVKIYGAPYEAFGADLCKYFQIINCTVEPRPGTSRSKSVHSAFEIHNSLGYFILENNLVRKNSDDGMHYCDYYLGGGVFKTDTNNELIADRLQFYAAGDIIRKGDLLELRNPDFSPSGWSSEIESFKWQINYYPGESAANRCIITFKDPVPENVPETGLLINKNFGKGQYIIRGNTFDGGMCHGLFICLPNGLIENNRIINTAYPGLMVHMVSRWGRWFSGTYPTNVIIRGNTIVRCNSALREPAALFVGGGYDTDSLGGYTPVAYPIAQNILIENNTISDSTWASIGIWSTSNAVIRNNLIINPNIVPSSAKYQGMGNVFIGYSQQLAITNNRIRLTSQSHESGIYVDTSTASGITLTDNSILLQ
jgi:hypothetical protein